MSRRSLDRFRRRADPGGRGRVAEEAAVAWLERQGYRTVERNVRTGAGEIDLIAREGDTLCFIEVKARSGRSHGWAVEAVGAAKRQRLARAAGLWLARHPWDGPCRFDVLGLDPARPQEGAGDAGDGWRYTLVRNAFEAG